MRTVNISIPDSLFQLATKEVKKSGFASISEYIRSLIREQLQKRVSFEVFEKRDLSEVQKELEKTGLYNQKFINSVLKGLSRSSLYARKASSN